MSMTSPHASTESTLLNAAAPAPPTAAASAASPATPTPRSVGRPATKAAAAPAKPAARLHRIAEVRQQQGVSMRTVARHLRVDMATLREQEQATTDLRLTELARWQSVLEVPLADLLVDDNAPLSSPVLERARLVRLMKTAAAIQEKAESESVKRLARMMIDQLIEVMPELKEVGPWHSVGQRRSLDEVGQVVERRIRDDFFTSFRDE